MIIFKTYMYICISVNYTNLPKESHIRIEGITSVQGSSMNLSSRRRTWEAQGLTISFMDSVGVSVVLFYLEVALTR
jgi:hypothetical protein